MDWLGPWLLQTGCDLTKTGANSLLRWTIYGENDARIAMNSDVQPQAMFSETEIVSPKILYELQSRINWRYDFLPSTLEPAKTSVSALRRQMDQLDHEAQPLFAFRQKSDPKISSGGQ